jgi:CRISPR-associated protein Cmr6
MDSRRPIFDQVTPEAGTHVGLWLERAQRDLEAEGSARQEHIESAISAARVTPEYRRFFQRWEAALKELPFTRHAPATVSGRMVVGLGEESVLETSITLHRTYGVPYIPGSALKGLAAAAAHKHLEDENWKKIKPDGKIGESHRLMFGDTTSSGYVTFHDALWKPEGDRLPLDLDVMTVHHPKYYQAANDPPPPADWDSPTPIAFLTARGTYLLAVTGPEEWAQAAMEILTEALQRDGIGAKTAAGYGRMNVALESNRRAQRSTPAPQKPQWEARVQNVQPGNAELQVTQILKDFSGEERQRAAAAIVKNLGKFLRDEKRRDKEWVRLLREAAGE